MPPMQSQIRQESYLLPRMRHQGGEGNGGGETAPAYEDDVAKALKEFFPELKTKPNSEVLKRIGGAVTALQNVVRPILRAYIYMRHNHTRDEWPDTDDFECLPFDSQKRLLIQTQLGINRRVI